MEDRYIIEFFEGGMGVLENIATLGGASLIEKGVDAVSGNDNHGWYCKITDKITGLKEEYWGATKKEAQEKTMYHLQSKIRKYEQGIEDERRRNELDEQLNAQARRKQSYSNSSSSESEGQAMGRIIGYVIGFCIIVYLVFVAVTVVALTAILLLPVVALAVSYWKPQFRKYLIPLSAVSLLYVLLDGHFGWLSKIYSGLFSWLNGLPVYFNYLNIIVGLVATYFLIDEHYIKPQKSETEDEYKKFKTYVIAGLGVIGLVLMLYLYGVFGKILHGNDYNAPVNNEQAALHSEFGSVSWEDNGSSKMYKLHPETETQIEKLKSITHIQGTFANQIFEGNSYMRGTITESNGVVHPLWLSEGRSKFNWGDMIEGREIALDGFYDREDGGFYSFRPTGILIIND